jgi:hypothetical protein
MTTIEKIQRVTILTTEVKTWSERLRQATGNETRTAIARKLAAMTEERAALMVELGISGVAEWN